MKFILKNPTAAQLAELKKLGLPVVYLSGNKIEFVVPEISEEELTKGDVVDLGLPSGTLWASCNIGADKPCDPGLLFQFGRVDGYAYNSTLGTTFDAKDGLIKTESTPPTTSGKTYDVGAVLDPADDAVYVATNGAMRMPTVADIDELLAGTTNQRCQCTVLGEDHTSHAVYGRLFTSKTNSNKIFIPAAGCFDGVEGMFLGGGSNGYIWSSSCDSFGSAHILIFGSSDCYRDDYYGHDCGYSVRGVCK